jgi:shikimate kinase
MSDQQRQRPLIYLAGFMGSGKSTIGPILANTLGFPFVDVDQLIQQRAGRSINAIFSELGEQGFRAIEHDVLKNVSAMENGVVSLGGGTLANEENFRLIHERGLIVYLRVSSEEAARRMRNKTDRPLLHDGEGNRLDEASLKRRVEELMKRREEFYNRADVIVAAEHKRVGVTVDEIVRHLRLLMRL